MMNLRFRPPPIYFMHVPKTAGRSVTDILFSLYGPRNSVSLKMPDQLGRVSLAELRAKDHVSSHYGPGLFEPLRRPGLICFTMLRDPLERVVSHLYFHQRALRKGAPFSDEHRRRMEPFLSAGIERWLDAPEARFLIEDFQTRHLGISFDYRPYLKDGPAGAVPPVLERPEPAQVLLDGLDMGEVLVRARGWLEKVEMVGITEHFAESLELLCAKIGVPPRRQWPASNLGPNKSAVEAFGYRKTLAPVLVERIEALNRYDIELYRFGCELFAERLARFRAHPPRTFCVLPRLRWAIYEPGRAAWHRSRRRWPGLARLRRAPRRVGWGDGKRGPSA
ncbi:MAG TPA: sulfotransferase family 2 domain-containing protein [Candidatus Aminicenantes bacterium]|nr:sulfotransferase family 2 domain-containing protein [Candidatus Aminicenantes bacterium]